MTKSITIALVMAQTLWALDVPIAEVEKHRFSKSITVNSKIVQLSSSKSLVMAHLGGKITKYLVKEGDKVKNNQAVALVSFTTSLETSLQNSTQVPALQAELRALRKRLQIANKNYEIVKKLYNSGIESRQNLNKQEEEQIGLVSEIEVIKSKLVTLNIRKKPSKSSYTIYAGTTGTVDKILVSPNAVVDANTPLVSIVKGEESFLVQSYVPLKYVNEVKIGQKGKIAYGGKEYAMYVTQILPNLDEETQQMLVLSSFEKPVKNLFVNAYVSSKLFFGEGKSYLSVKKSALSFFNNEWVVFVPTEHHEEDEKEHEGEKHDEHEDEHNEHAEHGDHDEHEEEEVPYDIKVVKIIQQNEAYVAIEGIDEHEHYVSDKSYYIKSLLLKSSLGGHGH